MHMPGVRIVGEPFARNLRRYGLRHGIPFATAEVLLKVLPEDETGVNVFEADWGVLIVLDTCRPEWLRSVSTVYDFLDEIDTVRSVGGRTAEWVSRTFENIPFDDQQVSYVYGSKYGDIASDVSNVDTRFVEPSEYKCPQPIESPHLPWRRSRQEILAIGS